MTYPARYSEKLENIFSSIRRLKIDGYEFMIFLISSDSIYPKLSFFTKKSAFPSEVSKGLSWFRHNKRKINMKKVLVIAFGLLVAGALTVSAAEGGKEKKQMTPEQKELMKKMVEKYDANKDGKLDKEERAKMSAEDKKKMQDAGLGGKKKQ